MNMSETILIWILQVFGRIDSKTFLSGLLFILVALMSLLNIKLASYAEYIQPKWSLLHVKVDFAIPTCSR